MRFAISASEFQLHWAHERDVPKYAMGRIGREIRLESGVALGSEEERVMPPLSFSTLLQLPLLLSSMMVPRAKAAKMFGSRWQLHDALVFDMSVTKMQVGTCCCCCCCC
jgi:hypothetical protein